MIIGIDEVGTGAWAGPIAVGACATPEPLPHFWSLLRDSKELSREQRADFAEWLKHDGVPVVFEFASQQEVDAHGLNKAKKACTLRAIDRLLTKFPAVNERAFSSEGVDIVFDGQNTFKVRADDLASGINATLRSFVKADQYIAEVSAASIVAKDARDDFMVRHSGKYPGYGFEGHVGYGTPRHREAIERLGLTPLHRRSVRPVRAFECSPG